MIYLDNAATTGRKPQSVVRAVRNALERYSANPGRGGHTPSMNAASAVYSVREKVADFFGANGPESVVFTLNCTHSINAVIKGLLKKGDRVVTSSLEHNAVMRPLFKVGAEVDIARVSLTDDNLTLSEFERKIRPETKLVICTGASNVLGKALPIAKIGACCKERGIPFAVDAAQTAGVIPINMREMNIDYLSIASHKGLYAPMGTGILICNRYIENTIMEGGTGTNSAELVQPDFLPERLESGTVNVPGIIGISAGIDYVKHLGMQRLYTHELELTQKLWSALAEIPCVRLYTPKPYAGGYLPVLSFNVTGKTSAETAEILNKSGIAVRAGLHCAPTAHRQIGTIDTGTVRVSPAAFNTSYDIAAAASVIKNVNFFK